MVVDVYKIRSSVTSEAKKNQLFKGTAVAVLGLIPVTLGGVFLPPALLKIWGLPIFFLGGALIVWGLLPYRRLCRIEMKPNEVHIDQNGMLTYYETGKPKFSIQTAKIDRIEPADEGKVYGMAVYLKGSCRKSYDIFLPYFKKNSVEMFATYL